MNNVASGIGRAIIRHFSGESPETKSEMVGNDARQDGAGAGTGKVNKAGDTKKQVSDEQSDCTTCKKPWSDIKPKGHSYMCAFCDQWFCANCAQIKAKEHPGVSRIDVFLASHAARSPVLLLSCCARARAHVSTHTDVFDLAGGAAFWSCTVE